MPRAVSNASPLIYLAKIGRLQLLREFHSQVLAPPAVWREVVERGQAYPETPIIERAFRDGWLQQKSISDSVLVSLLKLQLDEGEAEAIALALQERTEVVLLDDSQARLMARRLNLQVTGVVGILIRAKREAKIVSLKQEIDRLREQGGFWLAEHVVQRALQAVGENDQV